MIDQPRIHDCRLPGINNHLGISVRSCQARSSSSLVFKTAAVKVHCSRCPHWSGPSSDELWQYRPRSGGSVFLGLDQKKGSDAIWLGEEGDYGSLEIPVHINVFPMATGNTSRWLNHADWWQGG